MRKKQPSPLEQNKAISEECIDRAIRHYIGMRRMKDPYLEGIIAELDDIITYAGKLKGYYQNKRQEEYERKAEHG